jgi:hypothetical protein
VGLVDVGDCADGHDLPLVGQVGLAHPRSVTTSSHRHGRSGDARRAVHHVVEHDGHARRGQAYRRRRADGRCGCTLDGSASVETLARDGELSTDLLITMLSASSRCDLCSCSAVRPAA